MYVYTDQIRPQYTAIGNNRDIQKHHYFRYRNSRDIVIP